MVNTFLEPPVDPPRSTVTRTAAARLLGLNVKGVDKLIGAGLLSQPLDRAEVVSLAQRPSLQVAGPGHLAILRTAPGPAMQDVVAAEGFHVGMSNAVMESATLGDWRANREAVLNAGAFIVTISTLPVAVFVLNEGVKVSGDAAMERWAFRGECLWRWGRPVAASDPQIVRHAARARVYSPPGGPIAYLREASKSSAGDADE